MNKKDLMSENRNTGRCTFIEHIKDLGRLEGDTRNKHKL